uniref:Uncharacterized protein n=1 Tax=Romanomermis culicivorax TaxID=13658 RepID=A0A915KYT8_ROMCU
MAIHPDQTYEYNTGDRLDCTLSFPAVVLHLETLKDSKIRPRRSCAQGYKKVKPKAPLTNTLYNNEFSGTACADEELHRSVLQRRPPPTANHFGFSDYPLDNYYDHPQPGYDMPHTSHCEEDSRIK